MSQTPSQEQMTALALGQHQRFIKNADFDQSVVVQTDDGPIAKIGEEEIPLLDMAFDIRIPQPGHVARNKALSASLGKILVLYDPENPTQEMADELSLIPVTIISHGFRNFGPYSEKADSENKLICYSMDGVVPSERVEVPLSNVCSELVLRNGEYQRKVFCPHAVWTGNDKPECRATVSLGFFDLERKVPVRLDLHGAAYGAWNGLQRAYRQAKNVARLKKKSINDYIIKLSVENNGTYMLPVFKLMEPDASLGKPAQFLPICKYYLETVFARRTEEQIPASPAANAIEVQADAQNMQALDEAQGFSI